MCVVLVEYYSNMCLCVVACREFGRNLLGVRVKLVMDIEVHYIEYAWQIKGVHDFSVSNVSRVVK